jgi:rhamnogalacturonan endolyase
MHAADIDKDGRDEIILGGCVLDDNGNGLWTQGMYHPDNLYVSDIDPTRPGLEIYFGIEGTDAKGALRNGIRLVDARTGELLWGLDEPIHHIHAQGLVSNIDARHVGMECYSGERFYPKRWLHTAKGELIADETQWSVGLSPRTVYWDASPEREVVVGDSIVIFPDKVIASHLEGKQVASLDIFGDWREEIIVSMPGELRIYFTDIAAEDRRVSLMEDPNYRNTVAHQSMGYHQSPLTSYYIGRE